MKKLFTLFTLVMLLASTTMAQIKLYVHQNDGSLTEFIANTVDSITFSEQELIVDYANGYQYVDMGLPSGLLWATCNIGAKTSTELGDYYAWGEIQTKDVCTDLNYKWYEGTNPYSITKYGDFSIPDASGCIKTLLELEDDAANAKLGGNWRMPTREEFEELLQPANTDLCLVNKNGVKGYLIVSKKNGNTIFLPAAGYKHSEGVRFVGDEFYYWTSSHGKETPNVYGIGYSDECLTTLFFDRPIGCTIRPVLAKTLDYTISFNANGAEGEMADVDAKYAQIVTLPICGFTSKDDLTFMGWNTESDGSGTSYKENQVVTISKNLNLYAQWATTNNGYEYIDLGLPSGLLWASCNIGAENPEEFGDYFAWGEVEPKERYEYDNYVGNATGKYNINEYMELVDDAARHNLGGNWRIPLPEEMDELVNECTWTWTTLNNVNGYEVKGPNGNTIFLPAAGEFYSKPYSQGERAVYRGNHKRGSTFNLHFDEERVHTMGEMDKYSGFPIRPVRNKTTETYTLTFNANGGEGEMESLSFEYAEYKTLPFSTFTKEGFAFMHWNTKADGTGTAYKDKSQITLKDNTTLYAMWTEYTSSEGYEYVDLGLSVKWATCNVGAEKPEDNGDYFAWGETTTKSIYDYSWAKYKWCEGTETSFTKYCISSAHGEFDNKSTLEATDDVANVELGGAWRMPTKEEFAELLAECEITELPEGLKFTAKNGNYIILPFGGFRKEDGTIKSVGSYGYYWTNELSENESSKAKDLIISENGDGSRILDFYDGNRCSGLSVRPVLP